MSTASANASPRSHRNNRSLLGLLGMVVLVGMGEHMAERFLPLYLQELAQASTAILAIGLLAGMDDLLSALYSFPGGYLSDRLGTKRALLVFNLIAMLGYLIVILAHTWWAVLVGAALFISWSALSLPATMELLAKVVPKNHRTMGVSIHALVRRLPKMLGPVAGGACIAIWGVQRGVRNAFIAVLLLAALAAVMQQRMIDDDNNEPRQPEPNPLRLWREMPEGLRNLLWSDILIRFCERIPDAFVVIWATRYIAQPVSELTFGWLSAIENITHRRPDLRARGLHGRPIRQEALCPHHLRLLHPLPAGAAAFALAGPADGGICVPRPEGVRRADPQGPDHGPGPGGAQGRHVRAVLPDPRHPCGLRGLRWRPALAHLAGIEPQGGLRIRRGGTAVVCLEGAG